MATGARPGEVLAIRWEDVDLLADPPTVTITGTIIDHQTIPGLPAHRQDARKGGAPPLTTILPKLQLSEDDLSESQLASWATVAARTGTLVEVNEKWGCPGPRALRAAVSAGAILVAGSDAHHARDVGRYDRVVTLLDEARP